MEDLAYRHLIDGIKAKRKKRKKNKIVNEATMEINANMVKEKFGSDLEKIKSKSRKKEIITARFSLAWISFYLSDYSSPSIGAFFGGRNHAAILNALKKLECWYDVDKKFRKKFDELLLEHLKLNA